MQDSVVTTHYNLLEWCFHEGGFHVGAFGHKINVINFEMYPPLFSRRQRKTIRIGKYEVYIIKPCKPYKIDFKI